MFHPFDLLRRKPQQPAAAPAGEVRSLADPSAWLLDLFGATPAQSGVSVTPQSAMRCTTVRACVEAIAEAIGGLPLHVYQREGEARERATDHPAFALLHEAANDWTPATLFREQITRDALLHGNGYGFVNRRDGHPVELIRLTPTAVSVELDPLTSEPRYKLSDGRQHRILDRRDVLHIAAPSIDGVSGASPVQQCREAIGVNLTIEAHVARLFGSGARPAGVLTTPNRMGAEVGKRVMVSWQAAHGGGNSGRTALLEEGMKFEPITLNSVDSQTLELWQHSILEICRTFRVPPHMVFELGRATWGNASEMGASFLRFTLDRWIKAWQGEVRLKLIAPDDRQTFYAEFLTDDLLRTDLAARATAYSTLIAARVLNPNEVRAMENRAPYDGGELFQNPNTTTSETLKKEGEGDA